MGIGASVFLMALGAILTFALTDSEIGGVNVPVVGVILMLAGAVGLLVTVFLFGPRRRATAIVQEPVVRDRDVAYRDRDIY
jgi:hypothetical protein